MVVLLAGACGSSSPASTSVAPTTTPTTTTTTTEPGPIPDEVAEALCARSRTEELGQVANDDLREASGLVASRTHPGVFWSHNDGGNDGGVYAIGEAGSDLGFHPLADTEAVDTEDIAMLTGADGDELLLADFGDNLEQRDTISIYRFAEPEPDAPGPVADVEVLEFVYPDRAHNAEALLVDELNDRVVIVTKEQVPESDPPDGSGPTAPSFVFEGALTGHDNGPVELVEAGMIDTPGLEDRTGGLLPHPATLLGFGGVPTGGDVSPDGSLVVLRTYETAWVWPRRREQRVAEAFTNEPCEADIALEAQGEAIAFSDDTLVTVGEGKNQPLHRLTE